MSSASRLPHRRHLPDRRRLRAVLRRASTLDAVAPADPARRKALSRSCSRLPAAPAAFARAHGARQPCRCERRDAVDLSLLPDVHARPAAEPGANGIADRDRAGGGLLPRQHRQGRLGRRPAQRPPAVRLRHEGARPRRHGLRQGVHAQGPGKRPQRHEKLCPEADRSPLRGVRQGVQLHDRRQRLLDPAVRAEPDPGGRHRRPLFRAPRQARRDGSRGGAILSVAHPRADVGRRTRGRRAALLLRADGLRHRPQDRLGDDDLQCPHQRPARSRQRRQSAGRHPLRRPRGRLRLRDGRQRRLGRQRPDGRATE